MTVHKWHDLTGRKFGRLTVLERAANPSRNQIRWRCRCACGRHKIILAGDLTSGGSRSCGCVFFKHGMASSPEYHAYGHAKARCTNPRHPAFKNYGGRGISFLYASFEEFFADVGPRPKGMTLDRIDNDQGYRPGNCRWSTVAEQRNNTRSNVILAAFGRTRNRTQWATEFKINVKTLADRIKSGWPVERALTAPPSRNRRKRSRGRAA